MPPTRCTESFSRPSPSHRQNLTTVNTVRLEVLADTQHDIDPHEGRHHRQAGDQGVEQDAVHRRVRQPGSSLVTVASASTSAGSSRPSCSTVPPLSCSSTPSGTANGTRARIGAKEHVDGGETCRCPQLVVIRADRPEQVGSGDVAADDVQRNRLGPGRTGGCVEPGQHRRVEADQDHVGAAEQAARRLGDVRVPAMVASTSSMSVPRSASSRSAMKTCMFWSEGS